MLDELLATVGVQERLFAGSRVGVCAVVQPDDLRWHVPSHRYDPALSLCLRAFLASIDIVISVHGFGGVRGADDRWTTALLGGTNRELAADLAYALIQALPQYRWIADLDSMPPHLRGLHPANPVNRVALGGVQLELPPRVRRPGPDYDALVIALAGVARDARRRCSDAG